MDEKQQQLFKAARSLFLQQGFKSTNIAKIAAKAGVAVGTFYNFYPSKTAIFIDVYSAENERVKKDILNSVNLTDDPATVVRQIVKEIFSQSQNNRVLQEWFSNPKLNEIIAQANKNAVEYSVVYGTLMTLIDNWQEHHLLASGMSKTRIISLFNALAVVDFHQSEIQTDDYFQLLNDLINGILKVILK